MTLEVLNLEQVKKVMTEFSVKEQQRMNGRALGRTAARLRTRVRQNVPVKSGELKKSIKTKSRLNKKTGEQASVVYSKIGYYATLLYGQRVEKDGSVTKISNPAGNWFEKVIQQYGDESIANVTKILKDEIRKTASKLYTKTAMRSKGIKR